MTKVNGNGGDKTNLEALKSYYEALNAKKQVKKKKQQQQNLLLILKQKKLKQAH